MLPRHASVSLFSEFQGRKDGTLHFARWLKAVKIVIKLFLFSVQSINFRPSPLFADCKIEILN